MIPSIDLSDGRAVQLKQGAEHLLTSPCDPVELAARFARFGPVAVVDLDAARSTGNNRDILAACCKVAPCRVGGGIRNADQVRECIRAGAEKVIIGTRAEPGFLQQFPREWLIVALDARGTEVVDHGWTRGTGRTILDVVERTEPFCSEFLFTQVKREGMLAGPDLETAKTLRERTEHPITVAGGIRNLEDITALEALGMNAQIGRAIYEGSLDLTEAFVAQVGFDANGLVPTIVQAADGGEVLMLAYSNAESLRRALTEGHGWYCSRSRRALWRKGATSGHTQTLRRARWDCDRDALLFVVDQTGPACHTGADTCFGPVVPDVLCSLEATLRHRAAGFTPRGPSTGSRGGREPATPEPGGSSTEATSYTRRLIADPDLLAAKLREEVEEVAAASDRDNLVWECADLLYHLLVRMTAAGVPMDDVLNELRSRFRPS